MLVHIIIIVKMPLLSYTIVIMHVAVMMNLMHILISTVMMQITTQINVVM